MNNKDKQSFLERIKKNRFVFMDHITMMPQDRSVTHARSDSKLITTLKKIALDSNIDITLLSSKKKARKTNNKRDE